MVNPPSCPICTGKRPFCIHKSYPFPKVNIEKNIQEKLKKEFYGPSYSIFVGKQGYPNVLSGPMIAIEPRKAIDTPQSWIGMNYSDIIELRSFLLRSKKQENIFSRSRYTQEVQELAMAYKPADVELNFKKTPRFSFSLSEAIQPMGPSGTLEKMRVTENVKVKKKTESIITDDLMSSDQAFMLYNSGLDVYKISSILSSGVLGLEENKKLVPSRWSTTASDDIIAKQLLKKVRDYSEVRDFMVFESQYLDNHFVILLMPGSWEFENFETWAPGSNWSTQTQSRIIQEYEPHKGRSSYAKSQAGGYYATRISVIKYLEKIKKQAHVVVFREVSDGYTVPLGVWLVRETSGKAFEEKPKVFQTKNQALDYIKAKLKIPLQDYIKESKLLKQKRIRDFFN